MDAVQKAQSGHPGTPMALAPVAYVLWQRFLRYDPDDPVWPNRDRFVLSNGHASMLLYALLHLSGVKAVDADYETLGEPAVKLDDIKRFRQLGSKCARAPRVPLDVRRRDDDRPARPGGRDERRHGRRPRGGSPRHYNRPASTLFDYDVYALCGDGGLMEGDLRRGGVARRPPAARQPLLDLRQQPHHDRGPTPSSPSARTWRRRFVGLRLERDPRRRRERPRRRSTRAFEAFRATRDRPTLIIVDSHIGYGSPDKQDTPAAHGEPLGEDEVRADQARLRLAGGRASSWSPTACARHFAARDRRARAPGCAREWQRLFAAYREHHAELADEIERMQRRELPDGWDRDLPAFAADAKGIADARGVGEGAERPRQERALAPRAAPPTSPHRPRRGSRFEGAGDLEAERPGRPQPALRHPRARDGRRSRTASRSRSCGRSGRRSSSSATTCGRRIRLSALMELPDHLRSSPTTPSASARTARPTSRSSSSPRSAPSRASSRIRPADANEVVEAWRVVMRLRHRPRRDRAHAPERAGARPQPLRARVRARARRLRPRRRVRTAVPEVMLIATGSEVPLAVAAHEALAAEGVRVRVVSMPSWELFEQQPRGLPRRACCLRR